MYRISINGVTFPVMAEKVEIRLPGKNQTYTLIDGGEVNVIKKGGLQEISFELLLPQHKYPFADYSKHGFHRAEWFMKKLLSVRNKRKPVLLKIARDKYFMTKLMVSLEDLAFVESADQGRDVVAEITLKEHKTYGATLLRKKKKETGTEVVVEEKAEAPKKKKETPQTYTIVSGDTLWAIAKRFLGNGARYREIYEANKATMEAAAKAHGYSSSSGGNNLWPGTVLTIPKDR